MKNSTVLLIVGVLGLGGVGTYFYLKNKKKSVVSSLPTNSSTTPPTNTKSGTEANSSLGLPTTLSSSADEQKNYLEAKDLARLLLLYNANTKNDEFKLLATKYGLYSKSKYADKVIIYLKVPLLAPTKINALGYKLLPNYDIEKM